MSRDIAFFAAIGICAGVIMLGGCAVGTASAVAQKPKSPVERPNASELIKKDLLGSAKTYDMPKNCVTQDKAAIETGRILFNELNNESGNFAQFDKKKQFGNCVACHNIEKSVGHGNIGPDLSGYGEAYIKSGARTTQFVFQKIADPRVDNPHTAMTVNLATELINEREVCDLVSYIILKK